MAKKYIDAELLKKEINKHYDDYRAKFHQNGERYYLGLIDGIEMTKRIIDSLQQEQPCDTCTNDKGCVTCKDGELWEGKPEVDLEKEIKTWIPAHIVGGDEAPWKELKDVVIQWAEVVARHFYILGLKNNIPVTQITLDELAKEGEPVSKGLEEAAEKFVYDWAGLSPTERRIAERAYLAGAEWQKSQMLKDAVEGYVNYYEDGGGKLMAEAQVGCPYHIGDKVKIVIVKEDKEGYKDKDWGILQDMSIGEEEN